MKLAYLYVFEKILVKAIVLRVNCPVFGLTIFQPRQFFVIFAWKSKLIKIWSSERHGNMLDEVKI